MKKSLIAAGFALAFAMPQAEASLFNFSYASSLGTLAGTLDGVLQADHNTVTVNSIVDFATFNGTPAPSLAFVSSYDTAAGLAPGLLPTVTLDGSFIDFIACVSSACLSDSTTSAFVFAVGNGVAGVIGNPVYAGQGVFGSLPSGETFNLANWQISTTAVPAPATLPLLAIGGAAIWRRRKAA
ncbi:MAG: PEP-CTERM sorting domain-containing protein [Methylovulum sp.]|nr:PEP-CTERM sorting domain-containing protein [Methylovulum sp.]